MKMYEKYGNCKRHTGFNPDAAQFQGRTVWVGSARSRGEKVETREDAHQKHTLRKTRGHFLVISEYTTRYDRMPFVQVFLTREDADRAFTSA